VTTGQEAVHGYDSVISDPARSRAKRYGIKRGARAAIRPDGYIGVISDIHTLPRYFAQLTA
jgi:hypothetical protein